MGQAGYGVAFFCLLSSWSGLVHAQAESAPESEPIEAANSESNQPKETANATVQLAWSVPEGSGCADEDEMRGQIERLSERSPLLPSGTPASYTIAASIEPFETTWRARVELRDGAGLALGARELLARSPTCRTLNVPVALVVVTLIDSLLPGTTPLAAPQAAPPPSPKPVLRRPVPAPAPSAAARQDNDARTLGLGAFGALAVGILPSAAVGLGAAIELRTPLPLAVDASAYLPVDELDAQGRGARFVLWHGGLGVCPELGVSRAAPPFGVRAQICAVGQLGAISAAGRGLTESRHASRLVAFVAIEPKLVWFLGKSVSLRASLVAGWVIERPRFTLDVEGLPRRAFQSDPAMLLLRIGVMGFAL
jgi:hypothetical protein